jgi:branched-chain amino acid transport system permease protein
MLRLSGIYLALGTAAFAVLMDRWLFTVPEFTVFGQEFALFPDQSINARRFDLSGISVNDSQAYLIFGSVLFVLLSLSVVWVRRRALGRRLLAMKDAPAACTTLGMNVGGLSLIVFAFSAALAGIGGAMYAAGVESVSSGQFDFLSGLSILLIMVVAGVTSTGSALVVAIVLGTPILTNIFPQYSQLTAILVAFSAVAVGRNPNGFIVSVLKPRWAPVAKAPVVLGVFVVGLLALWVLRLEMVIDNWTWAIASLVLLMLLPVAASISSRYRHPERTGDDHSTFPQVLPEPTTERREQSRVLR